MQNLYKKHLEQLQERMRYRKLPACGQAPISLIADFSTNDYLCLSRHPAPIAAAKAAAEKYGVGATGSRLLSGNCALFSEFEKQIAQDKNTEAALIFNSGFQANFSALSCLLDEKILQKKPIVFFDKLNHSSLYQALFLSTAELVRFAHADIGQLKKHLQHYEKSDRPKFIVTETIFGMDGDCAPLNEIVALAERFNCFLYLDEAHATGVFGKGGYGLSTLLELEKIPFLIMGTFSKALGCSGAYVASSKLLCDFIINKAAGFIYSTAPSPVNVAAAFAAWKLLPSLEQERLLLQEKAQDLRADLLKKGFDCGTSQTHILPILIGSEERSLHAQHALLQKGIKISSIRPPTVPPGTSRLRIALTINHNQQDLSALVDALTKLF